MTDQPVLRRRSLAALPSPQRQRQRQRGAALFVGLVILAAVSVIATIGTRAAATWTSVSDGLSPATTAPASR